MSTQNVERELRAVLNRHAEDAMDSTDTHAEHERLNDVLEAEPRTDRRRWAVAVAAAAAAVTAVAVLSTVPGDDGTAPPPTNHGSAEQLEREAELLAERVVAAYADHDFDAVAAHLKPGIQPQITWPGLRREVERNRAWNVEYLLGDCTATHQSSIGTFVECPTDLHVLYSEEAGVGPFQDNLFSLLVNDGFVVTGEISIPFEFNGTMEHVEAFWAWLVENHPEDTAFLDQDEPDVPAVDWRRWLRLYEKRAGEYGEAMTSEGNG